MSKKIVRWMRNLEQVLRPNRGFSRKLNVVGAGTIDEVIARTLKKKSSVKEAIAKLPFNLLKAPFVWVWMPLYLTTNMKSVSDTEIEEFLGPTFIFGGLAALPLVLLMYPFVSPLFEEEDEDDAPLKKKTALETFKNLVGHAVIACSILLGVSAIIIAAPFAAAFSSITTLFLRTGQEMKRREFIRRRIRQSNSSLSGDALKEICSWAEGGAPSIMKAELERGNPKIAIKLMRLALVSRDMDSPHIENESIFIAKTDESEDFLRDFLSSDSEIYLEDREIAKLLARHRGEERERRWLINASKRLGVMLLRNLWEEDGKDPDSAALRLVLESEGRYVEKMLEFAASAAVIERSELLARVESKKLLDSVENGRASGRKRL